VGNRMAMPAEPQATTTAGVAPELSAGLRLIALPVVSEEPNAQRVLGFEADKLAVYEPASGYVRYPNVALQVGRGYWVQLPAAQRPNIRGDVPDESQPFTIPLQQGWNLIGNPWLESLSWNLSALQVSLGGQTKSLAEARAAGWLEDYAWTWDGSKYVLIYDNSIVPGVISQLEAWQGCWVYAHQACNLILPSPAEGRAATGRRAENGRSGWSFPVRLQYAGETAEVTVGVSTSGRGLSVGLPPAPPSSSTGSLKLPLLRSGQRFGQANVEPLRRVDTCSGREQPADAHLRQYRERATRHRAVAGGSKDRQETLSAHDRVVSVCARAGRDHATVPGDCRA